MKILITGANGMLGSTLTEMLLKTEHEILATGKGEFRYTQLTFNNKSKYASLDILNPKDIEDVIGNFKPDTIIHAAAMTQVDECEQNKELCSSINIVASKQLMAAAQKIGAAFYYISTDFVFSGEDGPYVETDQPGPVNYYGESKLQTEEALKASDLGWCIIRTVLLYGKTDHIKRSNFIYWVRDSLLAQKPVKVVNDQIRTPTYIPDLAEGIIKAVELQARGVYHISGDDILTPYEMAIHVADYLKLNKSLITAVDAATFTQPGKRPQKTGFFIKKATEDLGYQPIKFKKALELIFG
jgi:dTDP-4-dehydrorhamnose reductase